MKAKHIQEELSKTDWPDKGKSAILALIDLKIEVEMEKALTRFENAVNNLKFDMDKRLSAIEMKFDMKFNAMDSKFSALNSKFNYLLGLITALGGIVALLKFMG